MDTDKLIENQSIAADATSADSGRRTGTVKLVEMGPVSVETKGFYSGLEIGYTPRS